MEKTKVIHCREIGFDCNGVVRAKTEEEIMTKVKEHAKEVHNLQEIPGEVIDKIKSLIREEE